MKKNEGILDRSLRLIVGLALVLIGALIGPWWIILIAIVPLFTGAIGICPLYRIFGMNTCSKNEKEHGCG